MATVAGNGDRPPGDRSNPARRRFLSIATSAVSGMGVAGAAIPFVRSCAPSARARARLAPIRVDISRLAPGNLLTEEWARRPIWVLHRTREMLADLLDPELIARLRDPDSTVETQQPEYVVNAYRSIKPEYLILEALCTHLQCVPTFQPEPKDGAHGEVRWYGGYFCPCHGSKYDLAGRVYRSVPAFKNLLIPPHRYLDETTIEIGRDDTTA